MKKGKKLLSFMLGITLMLSGTSIPTQAAEEGRTVPHYDIRNVGGTWDGIHYKLPDGTLVTDAFFCDGTYTYYLQANGTPMTDKLTYHPDGKHIIYFDTNGHEIFGNFQYCPSVGYTCYFDSQGYIYKDQLTFMNNKTYYLDGDGRMKQSGWFQFANGMDYGYANWDGTLMNGGFSYDPWGRIVFYHWNGMVARGLITDGATYYNMDMTDGHLIGTFPNTTGNTGGGQDQPNQPAHTHAYEATITKQPTCTGNGIRTYNCSCGDSYTESIAATGHTWNSGNVTKEATCTESGGKTYTCTKCGQTRTETIPATGHTAALEWEITKPASTEAAQTLDDFGTRVKKCTTCGTVLSEETIITIDMGNGETKQICGVFDEQKAKETFEQTNAYRIKNGLNELTWMPTWEKYSKIRAVEISELYSHNRPNGELTITGENIAWGCSLDSSDKVMTSWKNSSGHNANLLNSTYTKYHAACFITYEYGSYAYYWVQNFM